MEMVSIKLRLILCATAGIFLACQKCTCSKINSSVGSSLTFQQDKNAIHAYAGNITLKINRSAWKLYVVNNFTSNVFMEETDRENERLGFGQWEGKYLNIYQGYLLRIGKITKWYHATNASIYNATYNHQGNATSLTIKVGSSSSDPTFNLFVTFYNFTEWNFRMKVVVNSTKINRVGWSYILKDDSEQFYGFGERFNGVGQRGHVVASWLEEGGWDIGKFDPTGKIRIPKGELSTYFPIPQFISSKNYGIQLNTWYRTKFDSRKLKDHHQIMVENNELDISFIFEETILETLAVFARINGKSLIPPMWAFGPWNQLGDEVNGTSIIDRAREMLFKQDIPLSQCINTVHYFPEGGGRGAQADQLRDENDQLLALGIKTTAYFNAMISQRWTEGYADALQKEVVVKNKDGLPYNYTYTGTSLFQVSQMDFTKPSAVEWYQEKLGTAVDAHFNGWMYDFGEYTPPDSVSFDGSDGLKMHNKFAIDYQKTCHDYLVDKFGNRSSDYAPDFVFYVRSGYLGSSKVTWAHWTGDPSSDWSKVSGLPAQISASLSIGISGIPFSGSDIGGFEWHLMSPPSMELWARWTQLGCFSGLMHEQGGGNGNGSKTHIFDTKEGTRIWRKFAKLRTQIVPYIYTMAKSYRTKHGLPLMRHHILDFPYDQMAVQQEYQFMFGDSLLVAPVIEPGVKRWRVYLPVLQDLGNNWINFFQSSRYDEKDGRFRIGYNGYLTGGNWYVVDVPLDEIPVFVVPGRMIVTFDPRVQTLSKAANTHINTSVSLHHVRHIWCWALIDRYFNAVTEVYDGSMYFLEPSNSSLVEFQSLYAPVYMTHVVQVAGPWKRIPQTVTESDSEVKLTKSQNLEGLLSRVDNDTIAEWIYDEELKCLWMKMIPKMTHVIIN